MTYIIQIPYWLYIPHKYSGVQNLYLATPLITQSHACIDILGTINLPPPIISACTPDCLTILKTNLRKYICHRWKLLKTSFKHISHDLMSRYIHLPIMRYDLLQFLAMCLVVLPLTWRFSKQWHTPGWVTIHISFLKRGFQNYPTNDFLSFILFDGIWDSVMNVRKAKHLSCRLTH